MKLIDIKNIEMLKAEQSITVKGGVRDSRGGSTATASPVIGISKPK